MYEKVLRSNNFEQKVVYAKKYYNQEEYERAAPLFEEVIAYNKGSSDISDYYYFYSYCYYGMEEYLSASFYFKQFYTNYPQSKYAENAMFMSAYCYYKITPQSQLDQTYTQQAVDMLQNYALTYQESPKFTKALELMKDLRGRLEKKELDAALLYYKTENYKAATTTLKNVIIDFPETKNIEFIKSMIVKSCYKTADKSILTKKAERIEIAKKEYLDFVKNYPKSKYTKDLEPMYASLINPKKIKK
jgi:outer membrane protein assembly factor BamD